MDRDENADRRRATDQYHEFLSGILASVQRLHEKVDPLMEVKSKVDRLEETINKHIEDETSMCYAAFPEGDSEAHRIYHEQVMERMRLQVEFWQKMRVKIGEMTVYAVLFCLCSIVVYYWNGHMPSSAHINLPK